MQDGDGSYDTVFDREAVTDISRWSSAAPTTGRPEKTVPASRRDARMGPRHASDRGSESGCVRGRNALAPLRGAAVLEIRFSGGIAALKPRLISMNPTGSADADPRLIFMDPAGLTDADPRLISVTFSDSAAADHRNAWGSPR